MSTAALESPGRAPGRRFKLALQVTASLLVMSVGAILMFVVALLTGFRLRRYYSEVMAAAIGHVLLAIYGVRFVVHRRGPWPPGQVVYISNHTSTIDMFVLVALRLPNARFFLSGYLRKCVPMGVIGYLIGIFWTVPQDRPDDRRRIFERAARVLARTGESVYLSPEGERITTGSIGHFNKGAFHLATALHASIVPMFIHIPREIDPGMGLGARPGTVHVHVADSIDTSAWRESEVDSNRDRMHAYYERWHAELGERAVQDRS